jgi:hypothetical protein
MSIIQYVTGRGDSSGYPDKEGSVRLFSALEQARELGVARFYQLHLTLSSIDPWQGLKWRPPLWKISGVDFIGVPFPVV